MNPLNLREIYVIFTTHFETLDKTLQNFDKIQQM